MRCKKCGRLVACFAEDFVPQEPYQESHEHTGLCLSCWPSWLWKKMKGKGQR